MRNALIMAVVGCLALTPASVAEDYGTLGATFEITEQDLLEWIAERLRQADEAGMLDQLNEDFRERVERSVNRPPAVQGIGTTLKRGPGSMTRPSQSPRILLITMASSSRMKASR
jgi:conjugal transfer pilus assembly protein TraW